MLQHRKLTYKANCLIFRGDFYLPVIYWGADKSLARPPRRLLIKFTS